MNKPSLSCMSLVLASSVFVLPAASVMGAETQVEADGSGRSVFFSIPASGQYQFRTDINRGGAFRVARGSVGLGVRSDLTDDMTLTFRMNYNLDRYSFRDGGNFGDDPWDDIHTINFGAIFSAALDSDWTVFGGPMGQFSRESGASWEKSLIGGGFGGVSYKFDENLTIGGGMGVVTQLSDGPRLFPIVVLDWNLTDALRLTSTTAASAAGESGLELIYEVVEGIEVAAGTAMRYRRFRLDDSGAAPRGIGQDISTPLWARLTYHVNPGLSVNLFGGVALGGRMRLEDRDGNRLARESYDPAPFVGVSGSLRF